MRKNNNVPILKKFIGNSESALEWLKATFPEERIVPDGHLDNLICAFIDVINHADNLIDELEAINAQ